MHKVRRSSGLCFAALGAALVILGALSFPLKPSASLGRPVIGSSVAVIFANGSCIMLHRKALERVGIESDYPSSAFLNAALLDAAQWDFLRELIGASGGFGTTSIPLWPPACAAIVSGVVLCSIARARADGRCACGYDLSGITAPACPECGKAVFSKSHA